MCYTIDYMVKLRKQKKKLLSPIQVAQQVIKIQADSSGMSVKEFKRKQKEMYAHGYQRYPYMDPQSRLEGGKKKRTSRKKK